MINIIFSLVETIKFERPDLLRETDNTGATPISMNPDSYYFTGIHFALPFSSHFTSDLFFCSHY